MKTKLNLARWLAMAVFLLAGVPVANAWYAPTLQRWVNRDPMGEAGFESLRHRASAHVFGGIGNRYSFAENEPILKRDAFGLLVLPGRPPMTEEDCDAQYEARMKDVHKEGNKCISSALKLGLVLEIVLGGGGAAIGSRAGPVGAGIGLFVGTGITAMIDICHYSHCMAKVEKKKSDAKKEYDDCIERVNR